jgi:hypothetical protein
VGWCDELGVIVAIVDDIVAERRGLVRALRVVGPAVSL